jgi:hypothetical protein
MVIELPLVTNDATPGSAQLVIGRPAAVTQTLQGIGKVPGGGAANAFELTVTSMAPQMIAAVLKRRALERILLIILLHLISSLRQCVEQLCYQVPRTMN